MKKIQKHIHELAVFLSNQEAAYATDVIMASVIVFKKNSKYSAEVIEEVVSEVLERETRKKIIKRLSDIDTAFNFKSNSSIFAVKIGTVIDIMNYVACNYKETKSARIKRIVLAELKKLYA